MKDINTSKKSCAAKIAKFLKSRNTHVVFGLQGGHIQPIWDNLFKEGIKIIDVRDEKAAVHMAQAYYHLTGKVGVVMVTAGPGVTNTVTGIANAHISSASVLVIGGCCPVPQSNMGPLQDIPHVEILKPITRYARTARVPEQVLRELDLAYSYSLGHLGEPGPAFIEIPTDILRKDINKNLILEEWMREKKEYKILPNKTDIELAIKIINASKKPLMISGRGANFAKKEIKKFIDMTNFLYLDTQESRGIISQKNPNNVYAARSKVIAETDCVILLGRKLDYQLAFGSKAIFKKAKFIRISNNPHELIDNRRGYPEILADPAESLLRISKKVNKTAFDENWINSVKKYHKKKLDEISNKIVDEYGTDGKIHPNYIFQTISELLDNDFIGIADGGDILSFARVGLKSNSYLDSGAFGCLGVGVPYAIAAAEVHKEKKKIICVTGDGSFGFNSMEIDTAVRNKSNICIIVSNNAAWNIETHDQRINYGKRVYGTTLRHSNYADLAKSLGAYGVRVENAKSLKKAIKHALKNTPSVVDVITSSTVMSSDAKKGLGLVPDFQALEVWNELEELYRNKK